MCNKALLKSGGTLESVPIRYKTHELCIKAVDNYAHALEFYLVDIRLKKFVLELFIIILLQC